MTETNRIEYKQELTEGLEKEVIAFLNYREGGIIYIGIDKTGNTYGLADSDSDQLKIKDRLKNNIKPSALGLFDIVSEEHEGKDIIKIIVASGPEKPYHLRKYGMSEKGCFMRIGTAAEPMPQKMIDMLFSKRTRNSISKIRAAIQDLSFSQLKIYYEESGYKLGSAFAKNLELFTEDGTYNYAAYLLADKNSTSIKVAKYSGTNRTDLIESNEYGNECLAKATKQVIDKIAVENRMTTKITSKEREQSYLWNPIALREAIINAFVHNDYTNEVPPKFEIFSDRIEITSAGGLPEGLSRQEFFEGFSVPRNKELMRIFKDLELVEQLGSGIPRILDHYGKESFNFSENFLRMTFVIKELTAKVDDKVDNEEVGLIGGQEGGLIGGQIGSVIDEERNNEIDALEELTLRQKEILKMIASDSRISRSGIAEVLHINESAIQKHLNNLKEKGFLERIGGTRGYWEIKL
ncbi:Predicted transcriptional regulator, contains HTH domain [Algibacter lectus]|uniref:RNA-binding domain-containing protein n=2 Tax=Algibacter lectus TaxID=221126 RepID=UPI0008F21DCE|nr:RNA-binding domain-containing protein [Algibacter lectus]SFB93385.1 Predicted transcriptional regulator, contains HTH domain [Algibacter lectus]